MAAPADSFLQQLTFGEIEMKLSKLGLAALAVAGGVWLSQPAHAVVTECNGDFSDKVTRLTFKDGSTKTCYGSRFRAAFAANSLKKVTVWEYAMNCKGWRSTAGSGGRTQKWFESYYGRNDYTNIPNGMNGIIVNCIFHDDTGGGAP
jgi:hypothetical protein